ncbi:secG, partial [Symbiodinium necroappetens]
MFADDVFGSWLFRTPAAFKDKTVILLASVGTSSASLLHKVKHFIDQVHQPIHEELLQHGLPSYMQSADAQTRSSTQSCSNPLMDLEGISRDDLLEAAAELQHLQTLALQGVEFATATPLTRQVQPQLEQGRPPILEVPLTPSAASTTATPTRTMDDPALRPTKYTRPGGKGPDGRKDPDQTPKPQHDNPGQGRGQRRQFQPQSRNQPPESQRGSDNLHLHRRALESLVGKMAQLMLRHEDFHTGLAQSTSWVLFEGTVPPLSTIAAQARIAQEWHRMKRDTPESIRQPLRTILFQTWAAELKGRLESITKDPACRQQALGLQSMEEPDLFPYK